ncbi:hypothetical protein CUMW_008560 [Citrus unshiu]|nr:hypothetical protein CUMW_008560 [Citrus unshiu]
MSWIELQSRTILGFVASIGISIQWGCREWIQQEAFFKGKRLCEGSQSRVKCIDGIYVSFRKQEDKIAFIGIGSFMVGKMRDFRQSETP